MSAVSKLHSPLSQLVAGATQDGSSDFGKNEKDKAEVNEWLEKIAAGEVVKQERLKVRCAVYCVKTDINQTSPCHVLKGSRDSAHT